MNNLIRERIFSLLSESSHEVTNEEMQTAYESFVKEIYTLQSRMDYEQSFRTLNLTRIEFISLQTTSKYEQGKKCA